MDNFRMFPNDTLSLRAGWAATVGQLTNINATTVSSNCLVKYCSCCYSSLTHHHDSTRGVVVNYGLRDYGHAFVYREYTSMIIVYSPCRAFLQWAFTETPAC